MQLLLMTNSEVHNTDSNVMVVKAPPEVAQAKEAEEEEGQRSIDTPVTSSGFVTQEKKASESQMPREMMQGGHGATKEGVHHAKEENIHK